MINSSVRIIQIDEISETQRIDNFLLRILKGVPRSHIYKIIRKGEVRVNKKRIKATYKLKIDDLVRVPPVKTFDVKKPTPSEQLKDTLKKSIIFEDKIMLVINKPAGIAVHGGSGVNLGVIETLRCIYPENQYLELAHRIDKATSGCLIVAKKRSFLRHIQTEIRERRIQKIYHGLVVGKVNKKIRCEEPLLTISQATGEKIVKVHYTGKSAVSIFTPLKTFTSCSLVNINILTGRTHQIRVHSQFMKHHIIGDEKYGNKNQNTDYQKKIGKRMFLHAHSLSFNLNDGTNFKITAPLDDKFKAAIKIMEKE